MFKANILADSTHSGNRLVTFEVEMPRYIWPEMLTHRTMSRNAQSTRAIPVHKMISNLKGESRVTPIFMQNCPGMSPTCPLTGDKHIDAMNVWDDARNAAIASAEALSAIGVHKQVAGRLLEPFSTIKAIISATEWDNFFSLRLAPDAQQEMQVIAKLMKDAMDKSTSRRVDIEYWHLPLVTYHERDLYSIEVLKKLCVARCARVSYLNHNGDSRLEDDVYLYDKLLHSKHCFIHGTCILTKEGFIPIEHITKDSIIANVDVKTTQFISWSKPLGIVDNVCDVYLYPKYNLGVSDGHTMIGSILTKSGDRSNTDYSTYSPRDLTESNLCKKTTKGFQEANLPSFCKFEGEGSAFGKLVGFYIGDGFSYSKDASSFRLVKRRKMEYLENLLEVLGIEWEIKETNSLTTSGNKIYQYYIKGLDLQSICGSGAANKKIPAEAYNDMLYLRGIFDGLKNSEGCIEGGTWSYSTTSKELIDQMETLSPLVGLQCKVRKQFKTYNCGFRTKKYTKINDSRSLGTKATIIPNTIVRGVTMPNGAVVIKTSTGEIIVTGNCSPFEHCATPMVGRHGNFNGWIQHRQEVLL